MVGAVSHVGYNLVENGDDDFNWKEVAVPGMEWAQVCGSSGRVGLHGDTG